MPGKGSGSRRIGPPPPELVSFQVILPTCQMFHKYRPIPKMMTIPHAASVFVPLLSPKSRPPCQAEKRVPAVSLSLNIQTTMPRQDGWGSPKTCPSDHLFHCTCRLCNTRGSRLTPHELTSAFAPSQLIGDTRGPGAYPPHRTGAQ